MRTLYLIPARGGSKGIPRKNIKILRDKPLICYSIDAARLVAEDTDICVSTDCDEIISVVQNYGLIINFKRPDELSGDEAGSHEVILHAIDFFEKQGRSYDRVMLLQPTSPFRTKKHLEEISQVYSSDIDMVVSVGKSHLNPYFNLFEEKANGFLQKVKPGYFENRQKVPEVYFYNGSAYLINVQSLKKSVMPNFTRICKYLMDEIYSVDIDTPLDWMLCEAILDNKLIENNP
ncbi:MAG: acylneuraminate cytidylyltransferase family protein [Janthinobacterium sp.]|jgi:N-acylneuraminate cytidylyltransferase